VKLLAPRGEAREVVVWHGVGEGDGAGVAVQCRVSEGVGGGYK
jgi:hypothetical protein